MYSLYLLYSCISSIHLHLLFSLYRCIRLFLLKPSVCISCILCISVPLDIPFTIYIYSVSRTFTISYVYSAILESPLTPVSPVYLGVSWYWIKDGIIQISRDISEISEQDGLCLPPFFYIRKLEPFINIICSPKSIVSS